MQEDFLSDRTFLTDDELVSKAKTSEPDAFATLIVRYEPIARTLVKGYNIAGLESDDLTQEALTGLIKAVRSFDCNCNVPFRAFALLCMKRQVQTAIKAGLAGKQQPLRDYIPFDDSPELSVYTPGDHRTESPESIVIMEEEAKTREKQMKSLLSAFEQEALNLYLSGHSYEEMSTRMKSTVKSVDNALQRVRRKLRSMKL
ncbi:sigma-70 family RNA polymerase sigma factor [Hydrogenoanaerobacterium sp.]|uniref:sigma-70 family RNA polymerase sigma factor n=1 Tax=Hydrogenoanaerobacterium sp. TaxID=2953763 RepID=UPI00289D2D6C|nr:sigma-70 family RNA polymerase sigma factor [Hydrogenoanaerobacterium sp.]